MQKIAIAMAKGGVGKTTTAVNLAYGLAQRGKKVLLVDCDTQGQTAEFLDVSPQYGLYEFVIGKDRKGNPVAKNEAIYPARKNIWLLHGGISLGDLKNWLYAQNSDKETTLAKKLNPREGTIDFMIFDCAPGWDLLSVNILTTVEDILCPVELSAPSVKALQNYLKYVKSAQNLNPALNIKYILPTMYDKRTRQSIEILAQLQKFFGDKVCDPINKNVRVSEAPGHGLTIFEYDKNSMGAQCYKKLVGRILKNGKR